MATNPFLRTATKPSEIILSTISPDQWLGMSVAERFARITGDLPAATPKSEVMQRKQRGVAALEADRVLGSLPAPVLRPAEATRVVSSAPAPSQTKTKAPRPRSGGASAPTKAQKKPVQSIPLPAPQNVTGWQSTIISSQFSVHPAQIAMSPENNNAENTSSNESLPAIIITAAALYMLWRIANPKEVR